MTVEAVLIELTKKLNALQSKVNDHDRRLIRAPFHAGSSKVSTITSGEIEATRPYIHLIPETGTTDTLNSINNGSDGKMVIIANSRVGDTITVNPYTVAAGNIDMRGAVAPYVLVDIHDSLTLIYREDTGHWEQVGANGTGNSDVENFTDLDDVPSSYTGEAGKTVAVNATEDGLEFIDPIDDFIDLNDTPAAYTGEAGKIVAVNGTEDGLEFIDPVDDFLDLLDTPADYTGHSGKVVSVKIDETGLEFVDPTDPGSGDGAGVLFVSTPDIVLLDTDSETVYTIPAGLLSEDGQSIWFEILLTTDSSDARNITLRLDSEQIGFFHVTGSSNELMIHGRVIRTGATSARSGGQLTAYLQNEVVASGRYLTSSPTWADPLDFVVAVAGAGGAGPTTTIRAVVIGRNDNDTEDFLGLSDTPSAYTGEGGNAVAVNMAETGLEFIPFPSAPVDSVNGQTGTVILDADDIAETVTNIWFTPAEETKLAGIEAAADVTDAGNIAAAISGASTDDTITDASVWGYVKAGVLVKTAWSNIKAVLKTYFDTLYVALTGNQTVAGVKTWSSQAIFNGNTSNSSIRAGALEIQSFAVNNNWIADNVYYDGTNFRYRAAGYSVLHYFTNGGWGLYTVPSGAAGAIVPGLTQRFRVLDNGNVAIGAIATPQGRLHIHDSTGGNLFVTKTGIVGSEVEIIPDGTGDVTKFVTIHDGVYSASDGSVGLLGTLVLATPGAGSVTTATGSITFKLYSTGQLVVYRSAGAATWSLTFHVTWQ